MWDACERSGLFAPFARWRGFARVRDRLDERGACRRRTQCGRRGWLVSWHVDPVEGWRARLSGPCSVGTIERAAPTRVAAIDRAVRAMGRVLTFQASRGGTPPPAKTPVRSRRRSR